MFYDPIFVYGTLMSGERACAFLAESSIRHAKAQLPGARLYSTGGYPIAVASSPADSLLTSAVKGEVHWLQAAGYAMLLERLDRYEGDEYERVVCPVELLDDAAPTAIPERLINAWVYLGRATDTARYPLISSGDWRKRDHDGNH